jgi:hypothetical protein
MQDAQNSGDDKGNERANHLNDDLPPSDAPRNDKSSSASGLPSEKSQHGKQLVDAVQMCPIKFGSFDSRSSLSSIGCASAPGAVAKATLQPSVLQKSAGHVYDLKQKKSWGARAEEDVEESLPSPLAPCPKIASEREKNEGLSAVSTSMLQCNEAETVGAVAADLLPLFSAAADERAASAIESDQVPISRLPGLVSDAKPGVFLGTLEVLPGQEARAAYSDPVKVDIPAVRGSPATASVRAGLNNMVQQSTRTKSRGQSARRGTGVFLGGRFSKDELIAFGGIPEPSAANIRSSERLRAQPDHDATQMERAQLRAATKNSPAVKGNKIAHSLSIASLTNDVIIERANCLGVSLGCSHSQVNDSIQHIKSVDYERTLVMLKKREEKSKHENEDVHSLHMQNIISLSEDLGEEEHVGSQDHEDSILPDIKVTRASRKKPKVQIAVRKSARLNKNK